MFSKLKYILLLLSCGFYANAQQANGRINSLLAAENYFSSMVKHKGIKAAFLLVSDKQTIIYRPNPVKAISFFAKSPGGDAKNLSWQPHMARIAKSGDWGFTSGAFQVKGDKMEANGYGQYLSVWKVNDDGIWKLALDIGISHPKPLAEPEPDFRDVKNNNYFNQLSNKRLEQRKELILITDRLLNSALSSKGSKAYEEFLSAEARLLFPGNEAVIGQGKIMNFWKNNPYTLLCESADADRSVSGDWAFTQGKASLSIHESDSTYHYVRIWQLQQGYNWNLVLEVFSPAGK